MNPIISDSQRKYTLFMLVLVFTSSHIDRQIMGILGQPIKESLMISDTQLGLLTGIMFAVFYATLGMPMAMWADRHNRRNLISFSVFLWSLMTALCGAATNFVQLLLLRIGVGVGEAGSNPPSHSIIADLYPPERRATAMAIFGTGINWGILFGFLLGGWINEWFGWRTAFVVVGLPGIFLAILVRYTVKEPPRGYSEQRQEAVKPPAFSTVVKFMWHNPVLRHIVIAGALISFTGYASVIWIPIYLVRIHEMGTGEAGSYLALLIGVGGALGIYLGGRLADFYLRVTVNNGCLGSSCWPISLPLHCCISPLWLRRRWRRLPPMSSRQCLAQFMSRLLLPSFKIRRRSKCAQLLQPSIYLSSTSSG